MEFPKSGKCLVDEETKIRWFFKRLYEEKLLSNDEYVVAIKLINEKYECKIVKLFLWEKGIGCIGA